MSDIELHVLQPARNRDVVITDDGATFNLDADHGLLSAARGASSNAVDHLQEVVALLNDDAPTALVIVKGTIPPGHPLGLPATKPNGSPY